MNPLAHPVEHEELMAYLDGQLPMKQALKVEAHIAQCSDCAVAAGEAQYLSRQIAAWEVEPSPDRLGAALQVELRKRMGANASPQSHLPSRSFAGLLQRLTQSLTRRRWAWGLGATCAAGLFAVAFLQQQDSFPVLYESGKSMRSAPSARQDMQAGLAERTSPAPMQLPPVLNQQRAGQQGQASPLPPTGPMNIRTISLTLVTKEFDTIRPRIDGIVRQSRGYIDRLELQADTGQARVLLVTIRIPSGQTDSALDDLKKIGRLVEESQNSTEVTSHYVDLAARLSNARNTEQRLLGLLRDRTGKLADVIAMEKEIGQVREQIERMEAEQRGLQNQVQFASVQLQVNEEYQAQIDSTRPSTGTRMRNSLIEGYDAARESAVDTVLIVLSFGPVLLLWSAVLIPVAIGVRRLRARARARS